jgi:formate-dependent nitrite reductase membrane component NrfD
LKGRGEQSMVPDVEPVSYYGRPILKAPVWKAPIPAYLFTGGLAAGSSMLAAGSRLTGNNVLARRSTVTAFAALGTSMALLVEDLGRRGRFVNMLRVAKPSSPMSIGSWLLATYGPATGLAASCEVLGVMPKLGAAAEVSAAALAPAVATYTAVLLADTAVPVWHEARRTLPFLFASGAAASAGAVSVLTTPAAQAGPARRLAVTGAISEVLVAEAMKHSLGELGEPYKTGRAGALDKAATACSGVGAVLVATAGRRRRFAAVAGGLLVATGAALERFAVFEAGRQSARDPKYIVDPQRARLTS